MVVQTLQKKYYDISKLRAICDGLFRPNEWRIDTSVGEDKPFPF